MTVRVPKELSIRDPAFVAPLAGLRFMPPEPPGWGRRRRGNGFRFVDAEGDPVQGAERQRLVDLAVPPAWDDVWFAPVPDGYLQATGFDDAGRKQYRYHDDYRAVREARKFERVRYFGRALPGLRSYVAESLEEPPGSLRLAVGAALGIIDAGLLRVGNEQSSDSGRYGATTLAADHVNDDDDGHMTLSYLGKGGKARLVVIEDEHLADVVSSLADADDDRLFTYSDGSQERRPITAADVNAVIAEVAGPSFSAKDFRTWGGSRQALEERVNGQSRTQSVDAAATALGSTRTVAKNSYVHPLVMSASDELVERVWASSRRSQTMARADRALLKLLRR